MDTAQGDAKPLADQQRKFQRYFIGLIVFIVIVLGLIFLTGRISLAL